MTAASARSPGRPKDEELAARRREQILDAATRRFARDGYHGMDVQDLADDIGTGKGTVYRHFPLKESLFLAAVDRVMRLLRERIDGLRQKSSDPLRMISAAVVEYLAFFDSHPEFVELLIQERAVFRDRKKPTYFEHRARNVGRWRHLYHRLMRDGRVRRMSAATITDVMSSALYGTMFTNFFAGRGKPLKTQAREILDVVFHGILTPAARHRAVPRPAASDGRAACDSGVGKVARSP